MNVRLLNRFKDITRFDASQLMQDYIDFVKYDVPNLSAFYRGDVSSLDIDAENEMKRIREELSRMFDVIRSNNNALSSGEFWDFLEYFEDIRTKMDTYSQMSKYMRSSVFRGQVSSTIEIEYSTRQNQTLEQMVAELGSSDPQQDWLQIALKNDLNEEAYTSDGGKLLKINLQESRALQVLSVVDNMIGDKVYGADLNRKITLVDNDLDVLDYKKTLRQTVQILSELRQNDNPEFPSNGIQKALVVGTNQNSAAFPVLLRQLYDTFGNDDTLHSFSITNIDRNQDGVFITFEVESVTGEVITENLII